MSDSYYKVTLHDRTNSEINPSAMGQNHALALFQLHRICLTTNTFNTPEVQPMLLNEPCSQCRSTEGASGSNFGKNTIRQIVTGLAGNLV